MSKISVGVLISGSGTNLQSLIDACAAPDFPAQVAVVISNRRDAYGLKRARRAGIPAVWLSHRRQPSREAYDQVLVDTLREHGVQWVCLAGFMRIITPVLLRAFPQRVLNIHPALLPAFPGLHGQQLQHDAAVRIAGATVHLVDEGVDTGPIVIQGAVPHLQDDDVDTLQQRILRMEHRIYPRALRWAVEGRLCIQGRRVQVDLPPGEQVFMMDSTP